MPDCDEGKPVALKPCREDCEEIYRTCDTSTLKAMGAIDITLATKGYDFYHLKVPGDDCADYEYSYNNLKCMKMLRGIGK